VEVHPVKRKREALIPKDEYANVNYTIKGDVMVVFVALAIATYLT
jgi:hypothetical protein